MSRSLKMQKDLLTRALIKFESKTKIAKALGIKPQQLSRYYGQTQMSLALFIKLSDLVKD